MAFFSDLLSSNDAIFEAYMEVQQKYIIDFQSTISNLRHTEPLTVSTSLPCNSTVPLATSTAAKTTAAIVPSTAFRGVDIVIYEIVDNQQL